MIIIYVGGFQTCLAHNLSHATGAHYDWETKEPLMDETTIQHVTEIVRAKVGVGWWHGVNLG